LKEHPDLEIRIESHTDSRGSDEYNMLLSKKRAKAAFDYVVAKGIDSKRLLYQGYGETKLLNNCTNGVECTEEQHEVNRRSIVKVVRKGEYKEKRDQKSIYYF
jgi:outer membrane protein OmpA-like peptidoglycan-associated protein